VILVEKYVIEIAVSVFQELNRKSLMVEEAVEEILDLVKKAAQAYKASTGVDEFDFMMEG
jgi:dynein heavy chain